MRRLLPSLILLAVLAAVTMAAPSVASAASCAPGSAGGENAPTITSGLVDETGNQGYHCTVKWGADVQPQYESGGTWHYCQECAPAIHQPGPGLFYAADSGHDWSGSSWTPTASGDTPACSVNWRLQVNFYGTNGFVFQTDGSPEWHKTC